MLYLYNSPPYSPTFTYKLEQIQYSAALAVNGAWRGTSRQRLYEELGWETLYKKRWYRWMCNFFCLRKTKSSWLPGYLFVEIPEERTATYNLRKIGAYNQGSCRTVRFSNT